MKFLLSKKFWFDPERDERQAKLGINLLILISLVALLKLIVFPNFHPDRDSNFYEIYSLCLSALTRFLEFLQLA